MKKRILVPITCLSLTGIFLTNATLPVLAQDKSQILSNINSLYPNINYDEYLNIKNEISKLGNESNKDERGIGSITGKVIKKILLENKQKIVRLLSKLPNGDEIATIFLDHFDDLINILDDVKDGVEGAIRIFFKSVGFSDFWADIMADAIMTVIGFFL